MNLWYTQRHKQPAKTRHPEKVTTIDRIVFYDREAFETFHTAWQQRKRARVLPTDDAPDEGDAQDVVSINDAATWLGFAGPGVIRKYLKAQPGYFPEPTDSLEGPNGRLISAFRRTDLQHFDQARNRDNTGTSGRPPGTRRSTGNSPATEVHINQTLAHLRSAGGYRRGMGAELAARHAEPAWKWERAVKEARTRLGEA
ncbi:hypothetical protein ACFVIM_01410 [Streptomyces sp. NPDC057638]|uniref:hypothetical protein n=1 Tax=Streptomyces sp. NPDC057638 TaxID=3346190 RepID=UPI0036CAAEFD